jgi:glycosyltransferase involved in cell wall biosynthesis
MDICILNPFFYPYNGGTEKVLLEIYKRLAKKHNITVLSAAFPGSGGDTEKFGIRIVRLKSRYINLPGLPLPWPLMEGLNDAVARVDADVYHINNRYLYYPGALGAIKSTGARLLLTLHNALPKGIDPLTDAGGLLYDLIWGREVMRRADRIVGITKSVLNTTVPKQMSYKSKVIYNGVDAERFKSRNGNSRVKKLREDIGGEEIILNVARFTGQKGQIYLLRAFSEIAKERNRAKLVMIGNGPLKKRLRRETERLGIGRNVLMLSDVKEEALPLYYDSADAFALPSLYEPASLALLEALSSGVPTVASKVGGIPEMMKDCGLYSRPRDHKSIQKAIETLLSERDLSRRLSESGRRLMRREHDWDRIANEYEALLLKLAE